MPADEFSQRMHHHMGPMLQGLDEVRCRQRVIHDQRHASLLRYCGNRLNVGNASTRIGDGFDEDRLGARRQGFLETRRVLRIRPHHMPAKAFEGMGELVDGAAIKLAGGNELIARLHQRVEHQELGGMA